MYIIRNCAHKFCLPKSHEVNFARISIRGFSKKLNEKRLATTKALNHFDDFYGGIFGYKWHSVRLGLLSKSKHVALLNNFGDIDETKEILKTCGALDLKSLLKNQESDLVDSEKEYHELDYINNVIDIKIGEGKEVLKAFYPEGSDRNFNKIFKEYKIEEEEEEEEEDEVKETNGERGSLHEALIQSQIDKSRVIDPSLDLDSSSLYEYVPVTDLKGKEGYVPEGDYYRFYKVNSEIVIQFEQQNKLVFPEHLNIYTYPKGDVSRFPEPKLCVNGVYNYYALDGGSILPVLALGLEPGDRVLDMCAAPGGKSLTMLQTMLPEILVCNDISMSRSNRITKVFHQFLDSYPNEWRESVIIKRVRGELYENDHRFNKILVDAPCTSDRISVTEEINNIFKSSRTKERLKLPEMQAALLENALKIVEPGGTVVYSTCTLSPIQNDGVVNVALQNVWKDHGVEFTVVDLRPALDKVSNFYRFATTIGLKYGNLVVPFVPSNFGPMYFCKLVKK